MATRRTGACLRTPTWCWCGPLACVHACKTASVAQLLVICQEALCSPAPAQGLAHCFQKSEEGRLSDCFVIEPISANALEVGNLPRCKVHFKVYSHHVPTDFSRPLLPSPAAFASALLE